MPDGRGGREDCQVQKLRLRFEICRKAEGACSALSIAGPGVLEFDIVDDKALEECLQVLQAERCSTRKRAALERKGRDDLAKKLDAKDAEYRHLREALVKSCHGAEALPER